MRRTRSRHVGRSVVSGATTPNRNGLAPPVAVVWVIVPVLRIGPSRLPGSCTIHERTPAVSTAQVETSWAGVTFRRSPGDTVALQPRRLGQSRLHPHGSGRS